MAATGHLSERARVAESAQRADALEHLARSVPQTRNGSELLLRQMISDLERLSARQRETIASLTELNSTAEQELAAAREEAGAVAAERDAARVALVAERDTARQAVVAALAGAGGAPDGGVEGAGEVARGLAARLAAVETELSAAASERDHLRRTEKGLRWRVELLETRLGEMRQNVGAEAGRVRRWIVSQVSALEDVLETSGVDVDRLIARLGTRLSAGQGGPLEPVALRPGRRERAAAAASPLASPFKGSLDGEMARLRVVASLLRAMPLVPPMGSYRTTSGFGPRRDPITGRAAMHAGLDFGGPDRAQILATAPGRVTEAGPSGAYGVMVEVDHGTGITTRYAHLSKALVRPGDRVELRQPVGIMGSTGRSTGDHLHYEVRVDGVALDPAQFLEAGRALRHVFEG